MRPRRGATGRAGPVANAAVEWSANAIVRVESVTETPLTRVGCARARRGVRPSVYPNDDIVLVRHDAPGLAIGNGFE